jgi:hypothetical protein
MLGPIVNECRSIWAAELNAEAQRSRDAKGFWCLRVGFGCGGIEPLVAWSRILDDQEALCVVNAHGTESWGGRDRGGCRPESTRQRRDGDPHQRPGGRCRGVRRCSAGGRPAPCPEERRRNGLRGGQRSACIIRAMPTIDSDGCRPLVLDHAVHSFRWHDVQFFLDAGIGGRLGSESVDDMFRNLKG